MLLKELNESSDEIFTLRKQIRMLKGEIASLSPFDERRSILSSRLKQFVAKLNVLTSRIDPDRSHQIKQDNREQFKRTLEQPKTRNVSDVHSYSKRDSIRRLEELGDWENLSVEFLNMATALDKQYLNKEELASQIGITVRTINKWLQLRPEFNKVKQFYGI